MMTEARVHPDPDATVRRELGQLFEVAQALHHGPLASVYVARDVESGATVALKTIERLPTLESGSTERFRRQAVVAARLAHPHIAPVLRHGVSPSFLWYTMDRCPGGSLNPVPAMPVGQCLRAMLQIASALDYAHRRGIQHANLRPTNVLLDDSGWIRVSDFGILLALGGALALDLRSCVAGALDYLAPELLVPGGVPGPAADQYALAVLAYECLAGQPTFGAKSAEDLVARRRAGPVPDLAAVLRDVPATVRRAVRRAMSEVPGQRFANIDDFAAALSGPTLPVVLWPAQVTDEDDDGPPVVRPGRRRRWLIGVGLVVVAAAGALWMALSLTSPAPPAAEEWVLAELVERPVPDVVVAPAPPAPPAPPVATAPVAVPTPPAAPPPLPPGRIVVSSMPWADLYVDGRLVGNTPIVDLRLSPGRHRLRLVRPGFRPHEEVVVVAPGQTVRLTGVVLRQEAAP